MLCGACRERWRGNLPVMKPMCFTKEEWEWLKGGYKYSPCRDCEASYQYNMARQGMCDIFVVLDDGNLAQLISDETMRQIMESEVPDEP